MAKYKQGLFRPRNPNKYKGDPTNIIYRSSWELRCMMRFDEHPGVIEWSSEEVTVRYRDPISGRVRRYFIDFVVKMQDRDGNIKTVWIEVKPKAQTVPPKVQQKPTKSYLRAVETWGVNSAKWEAAKSVCEEMGYEFQILTEEHILGK